MMLLCRVLHVTHCVFFWGAAIAATVVARIYCSSADAQLLSYISTHLRADRRRRNYYLYTVLLVSLIITGVAMSPLMCMVFVANLVLMKEVFVQSTSMTAEESFERTLKSANKFKCGIPQPRNFAVSEIFDSNMSSFCYIVLPPSAVLHVCDFACGSCAQHYHCQPKDSEEVTLAFKIVPRNNNDKDGSCHFTSSANRIETVTKVNHTRCSCQKPSNTPK